MRLQPLLMNSFWSKIHYSTTLKISEEDEAYYPARKSTQIKYDGVFNSGEENESQIDITLNITELKVWDFAMVKILVVS